MRTPFSYMTQKELVYASILSFLLLFLSFICYIRIEPTEFPELYYALYGFPLAWFRTKSHVTLYFVHEIEILWLELFLDFIIYFLLSLALVYVVATLREKYF